eukprot:TRINITY_DN1994_c0_g2_i2.p1 TRINITY_DN1994_c0_g2~~TRINITY_DN1994_c0_g2_i2.p1  ORF type:complete len:180 (-),score=70.90 TRINITY_DN1994_c0_g2_i2:100-639(-)
MIRNFKVERVGDLPSDSTPLSHLHETPEEKAIIQFLEGFALGIESDFGNVSACIKDAAETYMKFDAAFKDIDEGIRHLDVKRVEKGITELGQGVQDIADAAKDCGFGEIAQDIEAIAKELQEPGGILKVIVEEVVKIFGHEQEVTQDFKGAIAAWKGKQYTPAGLYVGKIVGILIEKSQ